MSGVPVRSEDVRWIADYDAALDAIVADVDEAGSGDAVEVGLFIIEPGDSSRRLLEALDRAAGRGARVDLSLDWSLASRLARVVERTTSLRPDVLALARAHPGRVTVGLRRAPDHGKRVVVLRAAGGSTAILGSMNIGDRFRPWRDVVVRVAGDAFARAVAEAARGEGPPPTPLDLSDDRASVIVNAPPAGRFEVRAALVDLLGRPDLVRYQIAMAYIDRAGAALLRPALDRGARVELVLPARANVYEHANRRAVAGLMAGGGALEVRLHPAMVHAKALVAHDAGGARVALVGSANLKRNSLVLLGELCVALSGRPGARALGALIDELADASSLVREPPTYGPLRAELEERLG